MARRVFLHVGLPKTGTTYLQTRMWEQRDRLSSLGFLYPGTMRMDHYRAWQDIHRGLQGRKDTGTWARLCREIAATWPRRSAWPPEEVVTLLVVSGTVELLSWWLAQEQPVSIEEIVEIHDRLIVKPAVKSQDGARPKSVSTRSRNKR